MSRGRSFAEATLPSPSGRLEIAPRLYVGSYCQAIFTACVDLGVKELCHVSLQVDLQQMEMSCDPEKAYSEECCELSGVVSPFPLEHTFVFMSIYRMCLLIQPLSSLWVCGSVEDTLRLA